MNIRITTHELLELLALRVDDDDHTEAAATKSEQIAENIVQLEAQRRRLEVATAGLMEKSQANAVVDNAVPMIRWLLAHVKNAPIGTTQEIRLWQMELSEGARKLGDHFGEEG